MRKVAVLVCGQMRTLDQTYNQVKSIYPNADFYVHAVLDEDAEKAFLLKPKVFFSEPQHEMPERLEYSWNIARGCHGVQKVLKQLWGLEKIWNIYEKYGDKHDVIVRWRPDTLFSTPPEDPETIAETDLNNIFIPKFSNYHGFNDRFAFGNYENMKTYFTRFKRLDEFIDKRGMFHPETFLGWSLIDKQITVRRTNAVFWSVRKDGSKIEPNYNINESDTID
jgi:hypothetical protein